MTLKVSRPTLSLTTSTVGYRQLGFLLFVVVLQYKWNWRRNFIYFIDDFWFLMISRHIIYWQE